MSTPRIGFRRALGAPSALLLLPVVCGAALVLAAPLAAQVPSVAILEPSPLTPASGVTEVLVEVESDQPIARVEILVNGEPVATFSEPPYQTTVNLGARNQVHEFLAVAYTTGGVRGQMSLETPAIRVDEQLELPLRQLFVTVTKGDERVTGLEREAFRVLDDERPQSLVTFEDGDAPLTAVLLVDSSESMRGRRLSAALQGVQTFTESMAELDEAKVMLFSDRLLSSSPFGGPTANLTGALGAVRARGGTALTDHLYAALTLLEERQGRRVVVLLSDGEDVHSALDMADVLWKVRRSQAIVYWIELADRKDSPLASFASAWRNADSNAAEMATLRSLVEESGGRIARVERIDQVEQAFEGILQELRDQYVLGYYPEPQRQDGQWRPVEVEVPRGGYGLRVRAREGYIDG